MRRFSLRKLLQVGDKGQSLVEMAIIIPLLIFMMIGVFEVGWAIRSYLVLVNINREITRFAVRPGYMDFLRRIVLKKVMKRCKNGAHPRSVINSI
ncbi:MAG: pilus assembly protein [Anaerolineales bacterium]|nr:pilus assembly protein [Anaerolineales bacterium]